MSRLLTPIRRIRPWLPFLLLALVILYFPIPLPTAVPKDRVIYISASRFAFSPSVIHVNPGDRVTLSLSSMDVVHGLGLDGYGLEIESDPGQTESITFTADQAGVFRFYCTQTCGNMHPFMVGKLQVGPNLLLVRAGSLALLALVAGVRKATP